MNPVVFACIMALGAAVVVVCILWLLEWLDGG